MINSYQNRIDDEHTLNSPQIICTIKRPCKRLICQDCRTWRRDYFLMHGTEFTTNHHLSEFVTIAWSRFDHPNPFESLIVAWDSLWPKISRKKFKYVRVLAIGGEDTPHVHLILPRGYGILFEALAKRCDHRASVQFKAIDDVRDLLGYLFDKNFIPTYLDERRPKRLRLLSASRGLPCGFPKSVGKIRQNEHPKT